MIIIHHLYETRPSFCVDNSIFFQVNAFVDPGILPFDSYQSSSFASCLYAYVVVCFFGSFCSVLPPPLGGGHDNFSFSCLFFSFQFFCFPCFFSFLFSFLSFIECVCRGCPTQYYNMWASHGLRCLPHTGNNVELVSLYEYSSSIEESAPKRHGHWLLCWVSAGRNNEEHTQLAPGTLIPIRTT